MSDRPLADMLWDGALLDLGTVEREEALDALGDAVAAWTPAQARSNAAEALARLDWRWRFSAMAEATGLELPGLERELAAIGEVLGRPL